MRANKNENAPMRRTTRAAMTAGLAVLMLGLAAPTSSGQAPLPPSQAGPAHPLYDAAVLIDVPLWLQLREQAERFEAEEARIRKYAERYRITPRLAAKIVAAAEAEGLDPDLGFRLIRVESAFRPTARGPHGALGLVQILPSTARRLDPAIRTNEQVFDPQTNLRLGFRYLRAHIDRFGGDVRLALLAYNRGEGTVRRALREGRDPENGYSHRVLGTRGSDPYRGPGLTNR
jgi:hypothetical protein